MNENPNHEQCGYSCSYMCTMGTGIRGMKMSYTASYTRNKT